METQRFTAEERQVLSQVAAGLLSRSTTLLQEADEEIRALDWERLSPLTMEGLADVGRQATLGFLESLRDGSLEPFAARFTAGLLPWLVETGIDSEWFLLSALIPKSVMYRQVAENYSGHPQLRLALRVTVKAFDFIQALIAKAIISERERALVETRRSEELLRSIINATPDWIFVKDCEHRYRMVNRSYAQAFHLSAEEFVGRNNLEVGFPEDLVIGSIDLGVRGLWADDLHVMESGEPLVIPRDLVAIDGHLHVFDTIKVPLKDADGNVWGILGFARDMTELKRAEEELRRYRDHLEDLVERRTAELTAANEQLQQEMVERHRAEERVKRTERLAAMGRLATALAHEINNPLQGLANSLELALDFPLEEEERREHLEAVRREIERLTLLTRRVLDFARPPKLQRRPTSVIDVIHQALALTGKQLEQHRIRVKLDLSADVPPVLASADHMVQLFLNLVINSIDAMPEGGDLHIWAGTANGQIEVTLKDSGPGIPADDLSIIFEPFYTTKESGAGLGLSISHSIVQQLRGTISARNSSDGGAVFTICLPVEQPGVTDDDS